MKILKWLFSSSNKFQELSQQQNEAIMDVFAMAAAMDSRIDQQEFEEVNKTIKMLEWKGDRTAQEYIRDAGDRALATVASFDELYYSSVDALKDAQGEDSEEPLVEDEPQDEPAEDTQEYTPEESVSEFGTDWASEAPLLNDDWGDAAVSQESSEDDIVVPDVVVEEEEYAQEEDEVIAVTPESILQGVCEDFASRLEPQWVREECYYDSARIIVSDQKITERERLYLGALVQAFGITPKRLKFITAKLMEESTF